MNDDDTRQVILCQDGGFALVGFTGSLGIEEGDIWLVRTDAQGTVLWNRVFAGPNREAGESVWECENGDFVIAGWTLSFGAGGADLWLIRTNSTGHHLWNNTYGGIAGDYASSIVGLADGGFAIGGFTKNFGAVNTDFWLLRTDENGFPLWNQTYGGAEEDSCRQIIEVSTGGFAMIGSTLSFGRDPPNMWLVRTDAAGQLSSNHTYGGNRWDGGYALVEAPNGGFAFVGYSILDTHKVWLVRTNANGDLLWEFHLSETRDSLAFDYEGYSVVEAGNGGFAVAGQSRTSLGNTSMLFVWIPDSAPIVPFPITPVFLGVGIGVIVIVSLVLGWVWYKRRRRERITPTFRSEQ